MLGFITFTLRSSLRRLGFSQEDIGQLRLGLAVDCIGLLGSLVRSHTSYVGSVGIPCGISWILCGKT